MTYATSHTLLSQFFKEIRVQMRARETHSKSKNKFAGGGCPSWATRRRRARAHTLDCGSSSVSKKGSLTLYFRNISGCRVEHNEYTLESPFFDQESAQCLLGFLHIMLFWLNNDIYGSRKRLSRLNF